MLDLLKIAGNELAVPVPVMREVEARGFDDAVAKAVRETNWLTVVEGPPVSGAIQAWDLGPGESAVLAWGEVHPGSECIIDDLAARRCAAVMGIPVRGTLGLVLAAKQRGLMSKARPVLEQLRLAGMFLSDKVMDQALGLVGE